jgi:hypothetical protein
LKIIITQHYSAGLLSEEKPAYKDITFIGHECKYIEVDDNIIKVCMQPLSKLLNSILSMCVPIYSMIEIFTSSSAAFDALFTRLNNSTLTLSAWLISIIKSCLVIKESSNLFFKRDISFGEQFLI